MYAFHPLALLPLLLLPEEQTLLSKPGWLLAFCVPGLLNLGMGAWLLHASLGFQRPILFDPDTEKAEAERNRPSRHADEIAALRKDVREDAEELRRRLDKLAPPAP